MSRTAIERIATSHLRAPAAALNGVLSARLGVRVVPIDHIGVSLSPEWFATLEYFQRLLGLVEDVPGDIVECGVASGESLALIASLARTSRRPGRIWGFDSWEGLPEPGQKDLVTSESIAQTGMFAWNVPKVLETFAKYGFDNEETRQTITLAKGFFVDSLAHYDGDRVALLHVDADLYDSYRECLERFWPLIPPGGIAAFDEYHQPDLWPGAKQAVDEFLGGLASGEARLVQDECYGKYYAVKAR